MGPAHKYRPRAYKYGTRAHQYGPRAHEYGPRAHNSWLSGKTTDKMLLGGPENDQGKNCKMVWSGGVPFLGGQPGRKHLQVIIL